MKLINIIAYNMAPTLNEVAIKLNTESYSADCKLQELTPLMLEIINFQMQERALFTSFENYTPSLN